MRKKRLYVYEKASITTQTNQNDKSTHKSPRVASLANSVAMGIQSIQELPDPKAEPKIHTSEGDVGSDVVQPVITNSRQHDMSMRDIKRRDFMRIDCHQNLDLGKSLNPPSFREHANVGTVSAQPMDQTSQESPS
jgi:hypothetical protein